MGTKAKWQQVTDATELQWCESLRAKGAKVCVQGASGRWRAYKDYAHNVVARALLGDTVYRRRKVALSNEYRWYKLEVKE